MIASIRGKLLRSHALGLVVEAGGVGYSLSVPLPTLHQCPAPGTEIFLQVVSVFSREGELSLYGFHSQELADAFRLMIEKVSGVGPRMALTLLSQFSIAELASAVAEGDVNRISKCPGVGKKTAERMIVELKDKFTPAGLGISASVDFPVSGSGSTPGLSSAAEEAVLALQALGFKPKDAEARVGKVAANLPDASSEALIKAALAR